MKLINWWKMWKARLGFGKNKYVSPKFTKVRDTIKTDTGITLTRLNTIITMRVNPADNEHISVYYNYSDQVIITISLECAKDLFYSIGKLLQDEEK